MGKFRSDDGGQLCNPFCRIWKGIQARRQNVSDGLGYLQVANIQSQSADLSVADQQVPSLDCLRHFDQKKGIASGVGYNFPGYSGIKASSS